MWEILHCTRCGAQRPLSLLSSKAKFCPKCGEEFGEKITDESKKQVTATMLEFNDAKVREGTTKRERKLVFLSLGLLLLGIIVGYGLSGIYHPTISALQGEQEELFTQFIETSNAFDLSLVEIAQLNNDIQLKTDEINTLTLTKAQLTDNIQLKTDEINTLTLTKAQLTDNIAYLNIQIDGLQEDKSNLESFLLIERAEKGQLMLDLGAIVTHLKSVQNDLTDGQGLDVESVKEELVTVQRSLDEVQSELTVKQDEVGDLTRDEVRDRIQDEVGDLISQISAITTERDQLQLNLAAVKEELVTVQRSLDEVQSELTVKQDEVGDLISQISAITTERDQLQLKYKNLTEHYNLLPQAREEYSLRGYTERTSDDFTSLYFLDISFPNPADCLWSGTGISTGSMNPFFGGGHELIANTCFNITDIRPGDIIIYQQPGNEFKNAHQVIEVKSDGVVTKGFTNEQSDPLVRWNQIIGIVVVIVY